MFFFVIFYQKGTIDTKHNKKTNVPIPYYFYIDVYDASKCKPHEFRRKSTWVFAKSTRIRSVSHIIFLTLQKI